MELDGEIKASKNEVYTSLLVDTDKVRGAAGQKVSPEIKRKEKEESKGKEAPDSVKRDSFEKSVAEGVKEDQEKAEKTKEASKNEVKSIVGDSLLQFKLVETKNEETGEVSKELVVYLLDKESGKVIRRIPPEEFDDPYVKENQQLRGIFIDKTG